MLTPKAFPEAWAAYPKRQGGNPRATAVRAWRARLRAGITAAEMVAGTKRYAEHCRAEGKVGTTFVLMAATFFGPDLRFRTFRNLRLTRARSSLQLARRLTSTPTRRGWLKPATQRSGRPSATVAPSTPTGCTATANAFRRGRMNAGELARYGCGCVDLGAAPAPQGKKAGPEWKVGSVQGEAGTSLSVRLTGNKAGVWSDFSTGESGTCWTCGPPCAAAAWLMPCEMRRRTWAFGMRCRRGRHRRTSGQPGRNAASRSPES